MLSVGQFCDNGCNQISWLGVFHSLLKWPQTTMKMLKELIYGDFDRVKVYIVWGKKKKGVSLKQKWVSFKTKYHSTRDFACPRSMLAQARLSNVVFLLLFQPGFLLCLLPYILHLYKPWFARFSFKKKASRLYMLFWEYLVLKLKPLIFVHLVLQKKILLGSYL